MPETGHVLKAALKIFLDEANQEEKDSIELFKNNLTPIYQTVFNKNSNFSATSLATYKSRVQRVLNDYEKYGTDANKMANWSPKIQLRTKATKKDKNSDSISEERVFEPSTPTNAHRLELALRPDAKFILEVPKNITASEVQMIKAILDSLAIGGKDDEKSKL